MSAALLLAPVDYIRLAGDNSPGIATVSGANEEFSYRERQPPFSSGAVAIFARRELAEFDVQFKMWTPAQLDEFETFRRRHLKSPAKRGVAKALDIWHPQLAPLDIKAVTVRKVGQHEQIDNGLWAVVVRFREFRGLPKQTAAKVEGAKAQPIDPVERKILTQDQQIQNLWQELAK